MWWKEKKLTPFQAPNTRFRFNCCTVFNVASPLRYIIQQPLQMRAARWWQRTPLMGLVG